MQLTRAQLKAIFETGDPLDEPAFINFIDSVFNLEDDVMSGATGPTGATGNSSAPSNVVIVEELADLPTPSGNVITLAANTIYRIVGAVDIGANRLVMGLNTTIRGNSPTVDYMVSSTTGALITSDTNFRLFELGFQANNGTIFDLNGNGSQICLCFGVRFFGTGGLGSIDSYDLFEMTTGLFVGYSSGLTLSGTFGTVVLLDATFFDTNSNVVSLDLNGATAASIKIESSDFTIGVGGTGLILAPNSGNISEDGIGIITGCSFNIGATGAVPISGYNTLDGRWSIFGNSNVSSSDRYLPTGWGNYRSGATAANQVITSTPQKLTIDKLGTSTNEQYLPQAVRGIDTLWDSVNNKIKPIVIGDSYDVRVDLDIISDSGNPSYIEFQLDIGGTASPTIVVVDRTISLAKTPPFSVSIGFPIFCLETFLTNGGQIFLNTDTGSVTIQGRGLLLSRNSSGAS